MRRRSRVSPRTGRPAPSSRPSCRGEWQLRHVLAAFAHGGPFAAANPRRMATIGWIFVILTPVRPLVAFLPASAVLRIVEVEGITLANLSIPRSGEASPVRLSTLDAMCHELGCQPGDILECVPRTEP
jgi:putative transcriptional regulator